MYRPQHTAVDDPLLMHQFIDQFPLGIVTYVKDDLPEFAPLPFIWQDSDTLAGHFSRANSLLKALRSNPKVSIIFQGPDHYISPHWYPSKSDLVPTWNYCLVKVTGTCVLQESYQDILEILLASYRKFEANKEYDTSLIPNDLKPGNLERAIIGIEIKISKLEAKFKISKNRDEIDRLNVIEQLEMQQHKPEKSMHYWMKRAYTPPSK